MRGGGRGGRFLLLYALANAGGVVAYAPLLTLLLPAKIAAAAAAGDARVAWLGAATLAGALAASLANIAFGWASDVSGSRRGWVAGGLLATLASYAVIHRAASPAGIVAAVVLYQAALNMLLAPLAAWAADVVPDDRKGVLGGLLGAGPAVGALAGVLATAAIWPGEGARLAVVCAIVTALVVPLLAAGRARPLPAAPAPPARRQAERRDFALLWLSRLLVQVASGVLFGFLLYYFQSLPDPPAQGWVARLIAAALALGFPLALLIGRASDRIGPRRPFLIAAAAAMAAGLALMAGAVARPPATFGYVLFACGLSAFLPIQATFTMQLLTRPERHGRDLGVLNLANTLPSVIAPLLAVGLVPSYGYHGLLWTLAAAVGMAGLCVFLVRCDRQGT